ncbi:hypothetical protein N7537_009983 [Penicillium hordei]|uniref:Uncharacterized protein n=1 Tax=Penicillium hordei TaxID=40994 RepID=A0AAD6DV66_9EURO|nr:uncharacterized protein N7537_009983 [Penicillium hordei]KAJ5593079.1 hypothetical protein N7537_009983 [Penicillium hordei]
MKPVGMKRTSAESEVNSPFARFKELLFCSLCAVALEVMPKEIVFQYMQSVFCCDAQPKALRGRIRGAKWANRAIYLLSRTNWGSCSWDIIYVASNQVNFYSEFNDYSIKPDEFINGLKPEFNPENTKTISVPLAIPSIIRTIFEDLVPLEKICECLGYELGDYNKLDLSGLETLLAQKTNTEPSDPLDTSNGSSHSPIYATSSPSAPNSCSDPPINELFEYSTNASTPTEGSLESPANSDIDDLFEEHPTSTSTPNESPLNNGTTEANDEIMDGSVDGIYLSTPINDPSTLQSISFNHSPPKDNMPDLALSLSNDIRAQSYPSVVDFEPEIRGSRPATSLLSGSNIFPNLDAESSMVTSSTSTEMNGTLNLESNSSSNIETSSARTTLSQTFSPNDITQQQGLSANDPQLPPSTDLWQQYDWELDGILQQGFPANDPQLLPSTHLCQQYDWELDGILQQGFPANDPQLLPSTHLWQQYDWELDGILQQGFPANDPQLLPSTHLWQQYDWELDGILQQGFPANDPQLPPSTDRSQQCSSDLLQQDLSLSSHSPLPSLGLGQDAATAISGNSPETRYHLLIRPSLVSREGGSSWDLENSHHALGFSDAIHQNASYSPNRSLSVM